MQVITLDEMRSVMPSIDLVARIEEGFAAYSQGRCVVPPVGEMLFEEPPGAVHIKYGYITGDGYYVIKIASGFYESPEQSVATGNGLMLLFSQRNGELLGLLLDEGVLTDLRTGAAGAVAAKYLAPATVQRIGIVGAGTQGRQQLRFLSQVISCRDVIVWGLNENELVCYREEVEAEGYSVETTLDLAPIGATCNLIVTATPSRSPLLLASQIRPGTHITAVGADSVGKQELETALIARADLLVVDSIVQCVERGECQHAFREGLIAEDDMAELGQVITGAMPRRTSDDQLTIADLTGVAVQDLQIAKAVYQAVASDVN